METIAKFVKELFFNDEKVDISAVAKFRYVLVGALLGAALTIAGLCMIADDDEQTLEPYQTESAE